MGYQTELQGEFMVTPPLDEKHSEYLQAFSETRRMKRDGEKTARLEDPIREAVGLPVGVQGAYYVGDAEDGDVLDSNNPPSGQPGLWCQWIPTAEGDAIIWDENEKFYNYIEWIAYIIEHFLNPWGYKLNGVVTWRGEEFDDVGQICIKDNEITTKKAFQ